MTAWLVALWSGPIQGLKGKVMVKFQAKMHRTMFTCTASVLALTMAEPAFAQTAPAVVAPADGRLSYSSPIEPGADVEEGQLLFRVIADPGTKAGAK